MSDAETPKKEEVPKADAAKATEAKTGDDAKKEKVSKPDEKQHEEEVAGIKAQIKVIDDKLANIKTELDKIKEGQEGSKGEGAAIIGKLRTVQDVVRTHIEEKTEKVKKFQELKAIFDACAKAENDLKKKLGGANSLSEIDAKVKQLEKEVSTTSMSLKEEKARIAEISRLKASKADVKTYESQKVKLAEIKEQKNAMNERIKAKNAQIDELRVVERKHRAELTAHREKVQSPTSDAWSKLTKQRSTLREEKDKLWDNLRATQKAFRKAEFEYRQHIRDLQAARRAARQAEYEATKAEREAEQAAREAEEAKRDPYVDHKIALQALARWISQYTPGGLTNESIASVLAVEITGDRVQGDDKEAAPTPAAPAKAAPAVSVDSAKLKEDLAGRNDFSKMTKVDSDTRSTLDEYSAFSGGSKKKFKGKTKSSSGKAKAAEPAKAKATNGAGPASTPEGPLVLDSGSLSDFGFVEVSPPMTYADMPKTAEALAARMEFYKNAPPPPKKAKKDDSSESKESKKDDAETTDSKAEKTDDADSKPKAEKSDSKKSKSKKAAPPAVDDSIQFPTLGGRKGARAAPAAGAWQ